MNPRLLKLLPPTKLERLRAPAAVPPLVVPTPGATTPPWMTTGRARPRYFDGRFLAARDLERDQEYVAARLAEYLQVAGPGVVRGLMVHEKPGVADTLVVEPGFAITPAGELLVVRAACDVPLADAATTARLDRELGLSAKPRPLARRGSGVYALLARPCSYTANPIGFYPASIEERRRPEDGEVVPAVAFTLVPFHDPAVDVEPWRQRAALARRLFLDRAQPGLPVEAVPLALVQLERGFLRWVDPWLVRREIGDAYDGGGVQRRGPRAVLEAHVQQYQDQLAGIVAARDRDDRRVFAASDELATLPPVGPYPPAALDLVGRAERFFPPAMPLWSQVVPDDELATIVEQALALPPIDLAADPSRQATTPTAILLALPRRQAESIPVSGRRFLLRPGAGGGPPGAPPPAAVLARLAALVGDGSAPGEAITYFARLRRAIGDTEQGVRTVERLAID